MSDNDAFRYEMPFRPNYEMRAAFAWIGATAVAMTIHYFSKMPAAPFYWMAGISFVMAFGRLPKGLQFWNLRRKLFGRKLEFISLKQLRALVENKADRVWLGYGFVWENKHAQRVFEILKRDWHSIVPKRRTEQMGQPWIHGVEPHEEKIDQPIDHTEGHGLILGTTGAGKTRMFDILISQAILRNEAVIIIDPKGDKEMRDNARRACEAMGQPERFIQFHPAFAEDSVRVDLLRNFSRSTEIPSRISALIDSEGGSEAFKNFGWQALNNITQGMIITGERPNLVKLRRYLEGGAGPLVIKAVQAYAARILGDGWEEKAHDYLRSAKNTVDGQAAAMMRFYDGEVQTIAPSPELEGLLSMFRHDRAHFSKMIANLLPIMNMLTTGDLGSLLSPDYGDTSDSRLITDNTKIINNGMVAYIGLDSLTDGTVASAIGSLYLSDLTSVAGDRYNYGVNNRPVNVFVDEAAEVLNDPFIQLLNKGRGAKLRLFVATQTTADFSARLGNRDKAFQVLGNMNNLYALRVTDSETQKFVTDNLPLTRLKYVMRTQGHTTSTAAPILHGGNQGERLMEEEGELFPAQLLGMLPNLEYIAKISGGKIIKGRLPILR